MAETNIRYRQQTPEQRRAALAASSPEDRAAYYKQNPLQMLLDQPRYESPYQQALEGYYGKLPKEAPDREKIREEELKARQARISEIEIQARKKIAREEELGVEHLGQVRAMGARGGRLGAPIYGAQKGKVERATEERVEGVEEWKRNQIEIVYGNVETRTTERYEAERERAAGNVEKYLTYLKGVEDKAMEDLGTLAQAGIDFDRFRESDIFEQIQKETGRTELGLWAHFENQKPAEAQVSYTAETFEKDGNQWVRYFGLDPETQQFKKFEFDMGVPYEVGAEKPLIIDGVPYQVTERDPDTGQPSKIEQIAGFKPKPKTPTQAEAEKAMRAEMATMLNKVKGTDRKVSPEDWNRLKSAWLSEGGLAEDFDVNFAQFVNTERMDEYDYQEIYM